jgi:undecaprenyl-diphosphatase
MLILQAIILGIIQGATEFIPISSSAHLIIVPWLFGWTDASLTSLPFDVALHIGTLIAVLVYFAADWVRLIRAGVASVLERKIGDDPDRRLAWLVLIGTIPGGVAGFLAESKIRLISPAWRTDQDFCADHYGGHYRALRCGLIYCGSIIPPGLQPPEIYPQR